eukprot:6208531-Pleurochrysis_carterae.AAC.2
MSSAPETLLSLHLQRSAKRGPRSSAGRASYVQPIACRPGAVSEAQILTLRSKTRLQTSKAPL